MLADAKLASMVQKDEILKARKAASLRDKPMAAAPAPLPRALSLQQDRTQPTETRDSDEEFGFEDGYIRIGEQ